MAIPPARASLSLALVSPRLPKRRTTHQGLKRTDICSSHSGDQSPKFRCGRALLPPPPRPPPKWLRGESFLRLPASGAPGVLWLVATSLHSLPPPSLGPHLWVSSLLSVRTALVIGFGAHLDDPGWSCLKTLNLIASARALFLNKVVFPGSSG